MDECAYRASVEKWDVQEITCPGPSGGNPFVEQEIYGEFVSKSEQKRVRGFYDGDGVYKVRFMPRFEEEYRFTLFGSFLNSEPAGHFCVTPPSAGNHGPVHVEKAHHFAYEDGHAPLFLWHHLLRLGLSERRAHPANPQDLTGRSL